MTASSDENEGTGAVDLARLAQITYRQLDYWTRAGYLHAQHRSGQSGYERHYDDDQIDRARTMGALVAVGFSLEAAWSVAVRLRDHDAARLGMFVITRARTCDLCECALDPDQEDVHPECLTAALDEDDDPHSWGAIEFRPSRPIEDVPDPEGRF